MRTVPIGVYLKEDGRKLLHWIGAIAGNERRGVDIVFAGAQLSMMEYPLRATAIAIDEIDLAGNRRMVIRCLNMRVNATGE